MSSVETTELKLKTTPTGGVEASHSPYYRRLLSAGYKGFLQGTIGGGSLYGAMGMVIGGLVALAFAPTVGAAAFFLIPAAGAAGVLKGASTFGNIGSVAAINAESADLTEQRRYLLDRYYDLPEGPEGDREAAAIKKELVRQHENGPAPALFHWKTLAIGAAIGAAVALTFASPLGLAFLGHFSFTSGLAAALVDSPLAITPMFAAVGALSGATIGLDRYYIRKWFDHTEGTVHSSSHNETALIERSEQIARLKAAARADEKTKMQMDVSPSAEAGVKSQSTIANLDTPANKISNATYEKRLADLQEMIAH